MSGQAFSLFGSAVVDFAIIWHITLATKSGIAMTVGILCTFLPRFVISLFAGVWADRYHRKNLIIMSDGGIALVTLCLALAFSLGYDHLYLIFIALIFRSIGTGIQTPAVNAYLPQIVPQEQLMRINGVNGSLQSFIMLLAPAASGALLGMIPLGSIFFIDVFTAILSIIFLFFVKTEHHLSKEEDGKSEKPGYFAELKASLLFAKKNVFVREMLLIYLFYFFLITPAAFLTPLYIAREFGEEVWRLTVNEIAFSVGMMLGGFLIAYFTKMNRLNTIAISAIMVGVTNAFLGFFGFYFFLAMMLIMGIFVSFFSATEMTLFQEKVELDKQGRVFSLVQMVSTTILPVGMLLFGPLGDVVNLTYMFLICGVLIVVLGIFIFRNKRLRVETES